MQNAYKGDAKLEKAEEIEKIQEKNEMEEINERINARCIQR
jgi:hypothetical protein